MDEDPRDAGPASTETPDATVPVALVVVSEFDKLRGRIIAEAEPLVLAGLVDIGMRDGAREVRQLRPRLLADHGAPGELQDEQDRAAAQVALSHPRCVDDGVWEYLLRLDVEAKAVLEAAIGPLSAPWHPGGARDPRSAAQRRGQALIEVCRRVTAAAEAAGPFGGHPTTAGTTPDHTEPASGPAGRQGTSSGCDPSADPASAAASSAPASRASAPSVPTIGQAVEDLDRDPVDPPWSDPGPLATQPPRAQPIDPQAIDGQAIDDQATEAHAIDWEAIHEQPIDSVVTGSKPIDEPAVYAKVTDPDPLDAQTMQAGLGAGGAKATLLLTMGLTDLTERVGAATTLGSLDAGTLLAPETARRIACDAAIIPVVLGTQSESST